MPGLGFFSSLGTTPSSLPRCWEGPPHGHPHVSSGPHCTAFCASLFLATLTIPSCAGRVPSRMPVTVVWLILRASAWAYGFGGRAP